MTAPRLGLRQQVGQLMIVGLSGPELSPVERAWLRLIRPAGVILFRRNIETPAQTFALLAEINQIIGCDIFRCADVEGGLVDRLRDCIAPMPSAAAVAATGKPALYRKHGVLIARELCALGFNTTLAPVLDLSLPPSRQVLQSRTASADPKRVIAYAGAFLDGVASEGIIGCGKHFPGLGGGTLDSHHATPIIGRTWQQLWEEDLLPYRALAKRIPMVMVSHAVYPSAISDSRPASISREFISTVLKQRIKYRGLVLSDDLEMGGILSRTSIESAAVDAIRAGANLVEVCKDPALVLQVYEAILRHAETESDFRSIVVAAARKVAASKRRLLSMKPQPKPPSDAAVNRLRTQIGGFAKLAPEPLERRS